MSRGMDQATSKGSTLRAAHPDQVQGSAKPGRGNGFKPLKDDHTYLTLGASGEAWVYRSLVEQDQKHRRPQHTTNYYQSDRH